MQTPMPEGPMTESSTARLFEPVTLGDLTLANRIVMAPLTRARSSDDGVPPTFAADYYAQRASAGLIVSEATNISPQARGYAFTPGIWSDAQVESWRRVTKAVHDRGGRIVCQLWHVGRVSHPDLQPGNALPVAPSAIRPIGQAFTHDGPKDHVTPRALETDEIPAIVEAYRHATRQAKAAGFDGVEIHSANNYLIEQFIRDSTNRREDRYGGSIENRLRFPLEVVDAVTSVWGPKRVGIRVSPATTVVTETPLDSDVMATYGTYIDALARYGLMYIHVVEGVTFTTREVDSTIDFDALRRRFGGAYIGNNEYTLDLAAEALESGKADLFAFGRAFIANPDFVERLKDGNPLAEAPKIYWYGGGSQGYSDWPGMHGVLKLAG